MCLWQAVTLVLIPPSSLYLALSAWTWRLRCKRSSLSGIWSCSDERLWAVEMITRGEKKLQVRRCVSKTAQLQAARFFTALTVRNVCSCSAGGRVMLCYFTRSPLTSEYQRNQSYNSAWCTRGSMDQHTFSQRLFCTCKMHGVPAWVQDSASAEQRVCHSGVLGVSRVDAEGGVRELKCLRTPYVFLHHAVHAGAVCYVGGWRMAQVPRAAVPWLTVESV